MCCLNKCLTEISDPVCFNTKLCRGSKKLLHWVLCCWEVVYFHQQLGSKDCIVICQFITVSEAAIKCLYASSESFSGEVIAVREIWKQQGLSRLGADGVPSQGAAMSCIVHRKRPGVSAPQGPGCPCRLAASGACVGGSRRVAVSIGACLYLLMGQCHVFMLHFLRCINAVLCTDAEDSRFTLYQCFSKMLWGTCDMVTFGCMLCKWIPTPVPDPVGRGIRPLWYAFPY